MGIIVNLDVVMAKRKIGSGELAEKIGIRVIFWNMPPTLSLKITKVTKGTVSHE